MPVQPTQRGEASLGMPMRLVMFGLRCARHVHLCMLDVHGNSHVKILLSFEGALIYACIGEAVISCDVMRS